MKDKSCGGGGMGRSRGKRPGTRLAWTDAPDERTDRWFPEGRCVCGDGLAEARIWE